MRGVDVAKDISFESCIDGDKPETTCYLRIVGNLLGTENNFFLVGIKIGKKLAGF